MLTSFALPLVVMVVIYLRIFTIISRHQKGRRLNHLERGSALTRGVLSASGPVGSAAAMNLPQLMARSATSAATATDSAIDLMETGDRDDVQCSVCASKGMQRQQQHGQDASSPTIGGTVISGCGSDQSTAVAAKDRSASFGTGHAEESTSRSSSLTSSEEGETQQREQNASLAKIKVTERHLAREISNSGSITQIAANGRQEEAEKIHIPPRSKRETADNNSSSGSSSYNDCDYREGGDKKGENLLLDIRGAAPGESTHRQLKLVMAPTPAKTGDIDGTSGGPSSMPSHEAATMAPRDGVDETTATDRRGTPGRVSPHRAGNNNPDCCPSEVAERLAPEVAAGGGPSGYDPSAAAVAAAAAAAAVGNVNPSRCAAASEARRSDSCRAQKPKAALRTQFSLGAQLLAPSASPRLKSASSASPSPQRLPSKSSLKKHHSRQDQQPHLSFEREERHPAEATKDGGARESARDCSCDNKLRQLSVRLACSNTLAATRGRGSGAFEPGGNGGQQVVDKGRATLVTMSVTSRASHSGSSISRSSTIQMAKGDASGSNNSSLKRPKLCRSLTSGAGASATNQSDSNLSRQHSASNDNYNYNGTKVSRTPTNASSVAGSSYYEPQRRHIHASAVPQTNTKALVTTLLILGTYFISYVPAILFQVLTCIDNCPYPLYTIPFSRRVLWGSITTLLVIAKSIIDPLIYSYRMSEVQVAINHYLSKRRSKSSMATSMLQTSQRLQAIPGGTSIYNNNTTTNCAANTLASDSKPNSIYNPAVELQRGAIGSLRILKYKNQNNAKSTDNSCGKQVRTTIAASSSSDDSPSKKLARRIQSFDKCDYYCPTDPAGEEKLPLNLNNSCRSPEQEHDSFSATSRLKELRTKNNAEATVAVEGIVEEKTQLIDYCEHGNESPPDFQNSAVKCNGTQSTRHKSEI